MAENVMTFLPPGAGMSSASTMGGFSSYQEMGLIGGAPVAVGGGASAGMPGPAAQANAGPLTKWATLLWALAFYAIGVTLLHMT